MTARLLSFNLHLSIRTSADISKFLVVYCLILSSKRFKHALCNNIKRVNLEVSTVGRLCCSSAFCLGFGAV